MTESGTDHSLYRGSYWGPTGRGERGGYIALSWPLARLQVTNAGIKVHAVRGLGWTFHPLLIAPTDRCVITLHGRTLDFTLRDGQNFRFYAFTAAQIAQTLKQAGYTLNTTP